MGIFITLICIGIIIGFIISAIVTRAVVIGHLRVDRSDPDDNPYLFLELSKGVDTVMRKKYVIFKVKVENFISHE